MCLRFPENYPQSTQILVELKSRVYSEMLLTELTRLIDDYARDFIGKPQALQVLAFAQQYLTDNPLCVCLEEIKRLSGHQDWRHGEPVEAEAEEQKRGAGRQGRTLHLQSNRCCSGQLSHAECGAARSRFQSPSRARALPKRPVKGNSPAVRGATDPYEQGGSSQFSAC